MSLLFPHLALEKHVPGDVMLCHGSLNGRSTRGGSGEEASGVLLGLMGRNHAPQLVSTPRGNTVVVTSLPGEVEAMSLLLHKVPLINQSTSSTRAHPREACAIREELPTYGWKVQEGGLESQVRDQWSSPSPPSLKDSQ